MIILGKYIIQIYFDAIFETNTNKNILILTKLREYEYKYFDPYSQI